MRKGLLAVLLVGASFAGGAAVNGLGHGWIMTLIQGHAPREVVSVSVDRGEDAARQDEPPADGPAPPAEEVPAAAPPTLLPDLLPPGPRCGGPIRRRRLPWNPHYPGRCPSRSSRP